MTNQEAIKRIKEHIAIHKYRESHAIHIVEALEMAISALQAQDVPDTNVGDTISRQAAIDAINKALIRVFVDNGKESLGEKVLKNVPPAQPEPIRINLNEPIKVKLTDWGKEIYYHQYDRVNKAVGREVCKPSFPTEDENGYTEFQIWCFMELYGEYMGMTLPNVVERFEIVYERRTGWMIRSADVRRLMR